MGDLVRFGVSIDADLLTGFGALTTADNHDRRGLLPRMANVQHDDGLGGYRRREPRRENGRVSRRPHRNRGRTTNPTCRNDAILTSLRSHLAALFRPGMIHAVFRVLNYWENAADLSLSRSP